MASGSPSKRSMRPAESTVKASSSSSATSVTVQAGHGSRFPPGSVIFVEQGGVLWPTVVASVATDTLTLAIALPAAATNVDVQTQRELSREMTSRRVRQSDTVGRRRFGANTDMISIASAAPPKSARSPTSASIIARHSGAE